MNSDDILSTLEDSEMFEVEDFGLKMMIHYYSGYNQANFPQNSKNGNFEFEPEIDYKKFLELTLSRSNTKLRSKVTSKAINEDSEIDFEQIFAFSNLIKSEV